MPRSPKNASRFLGRWRRRAAVARRSISQIPLPFRIVGTVLIVLTIGVVANLICQVIRKPGELLFFVGHRFDKEPPETWREYGPLFRTYATRSISPELLAALAQVESSGNPVDRTYWRWKFSFNPFNIYRPASSAVGLFQMTDPAYAEVARFCVREKSVRQTDCGLGPYLRVVPSHAVELASIYLDRNMAAVLNRAGNVNASDRQKQDLAAFIHLCGGGPATAYARRHFRMDMTERCGDHLVAAYVSKVQAMRQRFQRLAGADEQ